MGGDLLLFSLNASRAFGEKISAGVGCALSAHEERDFEDGEHKSRPLVNVRERDVFVIHSLYSDAEQSVNDKLCRLLFFIGALRDAGAARVAAVIPYLAYARKDRKTQARDPVTTRYMAQLLESVGTDRVVTLDVHNIAAFQNAFRLRTEHLEAKMLFVTFFVPKVGDADVVVVSPDIGGVKRAEQFRQSLAAKLNRDIASAFMQKQRARGVVSGETMVGEVEGRVAIIIDDLISTGTTIARAVKACRASGATTVYACATHGLFVGKANTVLADPMLTQLVVTDTVPSFRVDPEIARAKLTVLDTTAFFAEAIRRVHDGGSLVALQEG